MTAASSSTSAVDGGAGIKGKAIGGAVAAAVLIATPFIARWEGKSNDPYTDIAGIRTVCYGETRVAMRRYSDAECEAMLAKAVEGFAAPVLEMTPTLADQPQQLAAATSFAYNIGLANYGISDARRKFLAGDIAGACAAFAPWRNITVSRREAQKRMARGEPGCSRKANGQYLCPVKGLISRRSAETKLCLVGIGR